MYANPDVRFRGFIPLQKNQLNSLDFVTNRLFMKLFRTTDIRIISMSMQFKLFNCELPSVQLERCCKNIRK